MHTTTSSLVNQMHASSLFDVKCHFACQLMHKFAEPDAHNPYSAIHTGFVDNPSS
jgi:hypothetical protein